MIKNFSHKGLEKFFTTGSKKGIRAAHAVKLRDILAGLDAAINIEDMNEPGWRLHRLKGLRKNIWSVTVNKNWRITFKFENGDAEIVNYEDYH